MKRKINIDRPKVSVEEISQRKNFDSVLKGSAAMGAKPLLKKPWFLSSVVAITAAIIATVLVINKKDPAGSRPSAEIPQVVSDADSLALAAFYKAEEAKPCIAPPIDGLNIGYTVFNVNAEKGATLDFKTGSKLNIPKNAFVDANGKPVSGQVELRYREFHDAADFFVSGIPMTYDSAGTRYQFASAGMMEMLAFKDGQPVGMAPGKSVNVELASAYKGTEYNLYKLDTVHNNWSCLGKDKVQQTAGEPKTKMAVKENGLAQKEAALKETPAYKETEAKQEEAKQVKETQIAALPKPEPEPKKPVKANKDKFSFNFDIDLKDFPEFAVYKNIVWEVGPENKAFGQANFNDVNKTEWEDATIKEGNKKGENYILTLQKGSKKSELVVYPVLEGKNYETAIKEFEGRFAKYNATLDKRKTDEKKIEEEYQAKILAQKKKQEELEAKWKKELEEQEARLSTEEKVMRVFRISSFGVYNCDNPSAYPKGVLCNALLTNDRNAKLMCYDVYLVDNKRNSLFTYSKNPLSTFSFDPASKNILWTVENGVLYYVNPEGFKNIENGTQNVSMSRVEQKFKTVEELKAFFSL
jgi:hypothetical protein